MIPKQQATYIEMLKGCYVIEVRNPKGERVYKLYTGNMSPVRYLGKRELPHHEVLKHEMVKKKGKSEPTGRIFLNLKWIRTLHGKSILKKLYKQYRGQKKLSSEPGNSPLQP